MLVWCCCPFCDVCTLDALCVIFLSCLVPLSALYLYDQPLRSLHMCMFIDCSLDWHVGVVSGLIYILVQ